MQITEISPFLQVLYPYVLYRSYGNYPISYTDLSEKEEVVNTLLNIHANHNSSIAISCEGSRKSEWLMDKERLVVCSQPLLFLTNQYIG